MLKDVAPLISRLVQGQDLSAEETKEILIATSREDAEGYYYLAFAASLMAKGATEEELYGLVEGLQSFAVPIETRVDRDSIIDVSGSGGDTFKTLNVSTATAFVVGAAGIPVAKQSFRAFSSLTGSSDVLEDVGVKLPDSPQRIATTLETVGIAPVSYSAVYRGMDARLKAVAKLREIGLQFPTPMHPIALVPSPVAMTHRVYGLFAERYMEPVAHIFQKLGYKRALVVHGKDGLDEISTIGETKVIELTEGELRSYTLLPSDLGVELANAQSLRVATREEAVASFMGVLTGRGRDEMAQLVAANAAAGLYVVGRTASLREGVEMAQELISSRKAYAKLRELVEYTGGESGLARLEELEGKA